MKSCVLGLSLLLLVAALRAQNIESIPNGVLFPDPEGAVSTYSTSGAIDLTGPFFSKLGTNGRACGSCHQPSDAMTVSAAHVQRRFDLTDGLDPIFRIVDGGNCDHDIDVSTVAERRAAYSLLRTRGLIRVGIKVPANADYDVVSVDNPYGCSETDRISMYRRPLPATNLPFLSTVMWDGRESSAITGTTRILFSNYPTSLLNDLAHQSVSATTGHAQGDGSRPNLAEQQQIVNFETALFTAQAFGAAGPLNVAGATGGAAPLSTQPSFVSINSSVNALLPALEQPGGLVTPGDRQFTPAVFNMFDAWARFRAEDPRSAIARGQALFTSKPINITGVAGINDDVANGGLVSGGIPVLTGTCGTCHDTPNAGNHSFPNPLNIGVGDPNPGNPSVNMGGLDISYLPTIKACRKDPNNGLSTYECVVTTDLGQAAIDGKFDHIGKLKGPILRGLSARAPFFHNGSARTLLDVVRFYESRFDVSFSRQDEADMIAFLSAL